jgi:hypothetical protein
MMGVCNREKCRLNGNQEGKRVCIQEGKRACISIAPSRHTSKNITSFH